MTVSPFTSITFAYENYRKVISVNMSFKEAQEHKSLFPHSSLDYEDENYTFNLKSCRVVCIKAHDADSTGSKTTKLVLRDGIFNIPGLFTRKDIQVGLRDDRAVLTDNATFIIRFNHLSFIALERTTTETTTPANYAAAAN
jgi:hypothetical protein